MESFVKEFEQLKIPPKEIKRVTNNFSNKPIGSGGFGQGDPEFWREIIMLSRYSHENLISLLGFCDKAGEKILVYELASNGSLDRYLSSPDLITWEQRIKICLGAGAAHAGTSLPS
uniref:L-type lectin-domain containing receptor kinase IV.1-like n=1 Tax=Erigeron canadensis TaxID=72917 RepID=UPI001CB9D764|nr:L-type lectin-domain containing receptor kinase IV.1-like [Erigeron canadensis]